MEYAMPAADLATKITIMANEILRFINAIVAERTKDNESQHNQFSSRQNVDMKRLSVTFGLHNAITQTVVWKTYDLDYFAAICCEQTRIEETFNELVDYMLDQSYKYKNKEVQLNEN
jgi:hypothetical protein